MVFTHAGLAVAFLSYPVFLQLGAYNGTPDETPANAQFNFCQMMRGEPAQSCGVTTRFLTRTVQWEAGDKRACLQSPSVGSMVFTPWRIANWDRTSLILYSSYYWESARHSKWFKARVAEYMLQRHREMDGDCNIPASTPEDQVAPMAY